MRGPQRFLHSLLSALLVLSPAALRAQGGGQQAQPAPPLINQSNDPLLRGFRWRSIGPAGQGGRVDDIAVVESNPSTYFIGFATGGIYRTENLGVTFEPVFDTYGTHSIGDIAIAPSDPNIVYVGTGEANNRQSSSFGEGIYKSTDGGKTFTHAGLRETQTIARIVVHPTNPNVVWVAANGRLFGPSADRGVFKSTDGGRTWNKVLYRNENTGATDLVIDPSNPNVLFAATYQRQRTAWGFASGGPESGIWRSDDGGSTWTRVTGNGLPNGTMARSGLDFARSNPNVIYAQIEVAPDKEPRPAAAAGQGQGGGPGGGGGGGGGGFQQQNLPPDPQVSGIWRSNDKGSTWQFVSNQNQRPMYYSQIRVDPGNENTIYVGGTNPQKSTDGGQNWAALQGMGHVDNHAIWIDPNNSRHVMYGNDGSVDVSWDAGMTWHSPRTWATGQLYHVSVDMRRPYHVCGGFQDNNAWCGPSSVRSSPILNQDWFRVAGGDGMYTQIDPTDYAIIYAESQNGNMNRQDLRAGTTTSIRPRPPTREDANAGNIVPAIPPFCQQQGQNPQQQQQQPAQEQPCTQPFRWHWTTPIVLSPHNPRTVYTGANRLFISRDRGDTWTMSGDLTRQIDRDQRSIMGLAGSLPSCNRNTRGQACILSRNDGTSSYGTIISIAESPIVPGILWVGTDDGNIQVSRDGGATWTEVSRYLPGGAKEIYVSGIEASYFDPATAYVSLDGHNSDDLRTYVYVTRDYGRTWSSITAGLPAQGNVNSVKQDLKNRNLLYAATEFGFFISLDEGGSWKRFMNNLPVVRVDEVVVHPRDNDLVLGTHGRSFWIMDDITPLQQLTPEVMAQDVHLLEPRNAVAWKTDNRMRRPVTGGHNFLGENAPEGTAISYHLRTAPAGDVSITITNVATGEVFRDLEGTKVQGLNRVQWDLRGNPPPRREGQGGGGGGGGFGGQPQAPVAQPGIYRITLSVGGRDYTRNVVVEEDVWMEQR